MSDKTISSEDLDTGSFIYMFLYYLVSVLLLVAMIFEFVSVNQIVPNEAGIVSYEAVTSIVEAIPYEYLIYALIMYSLGMFGLEATRSVIMSMEITGMAEKAKNMPRYKRNRLIQMIIVFIVFAIISMAFQMNTVNMVKTDFHSKPFFMGITVYLMLLSYADFGPKLGAEIKRNKISTMEFETKKESEEEK